MTPAPAATWRSNIGVIRLAWIVAVVSLGADTLGADLSPKLFRPGRHVCTTKKEESTRLKRFEAFRRPVYQSYAHRCEDKICRGVRVVYETGYRDVTEGESSPSYHCCPGWTQGPWTTLGCTSPVCSKICQNNGTCVQPEQCACPKGFTGQQCENDVDECLERKPCSQLCTNSVGSYQCTCKPGYKLAPDLHTCTRKGKNKKNNGKFDVEILARKISKLEKLYRKSSNYELQTELSDSPSNEELQSSFDNLQKKFEAMSRYQQERWMQLEEDMERLQPLCARMDTLENKLAQCACKCKEQVFSRIFP